MCKVEVDLRVVEENWKYNLSRFQCLTMALQDLKQFARGNRLHYVLDGYDFCNWFFPPSARSPNKFHRVIRGTWDRFFELSDGVESCAVMSPFTIMEFLYRMVMRLDDQPIQKLVAQNTVVSDLINAIQEGEKQLIDAPEHQQRIVRQLYGQILDHKLAIDLMSVSAAFARLQLLFGQQKIRLFDPLIPDSAQIIELLEYDVKKTKDAIQYLHISRQGSNRARDLYNTVDAYHFILIENSRRSLSVDHIVPNLTSSGIYSRNSWYMLKYSRLPDLHEVTIPADWNVRSADAPTLLLAAIAYNGERPGAADTTEAFLEDARSIARVIRQDLVSIPEVHQCRTNKIIRQRLLRDNPVVRVSSSTVELMRRLNRDYLDPIGQASLDTSSIENPLSDISKGEVEEMQEFLKNPEKYATSRKEVTEKVTQNVRQLNLPSPRLNSYILPLGEDGQELWEAIQGVAGYDVR